MRVAICDDEPFWMNEVETMLLDAARRRACPLELFRFYDGDPLLAAHRDDPFDAVLLDIEMSTFDGFSVAQSLCEVKPDILLIFITSHDELVFSAFRYQPFWFLRKDYLHTRGGEVFDRLVDRLALQQRRNRLFRLVVRDKESMLVLPEILYLQTVGHYIHFITEGEELPRIRATMNEVAEQLEPEGFVRVQTGVLLNALHISTINSRFVTLKNGRHFTVGRKWSQSAKDKFQEHMRNQRWI